jgi:hypothetical protein
MQAQHSRHFWQVGSLVVARLALLVGILGLCAIRLPAVPVSAAPPSLTATPNPVYIQVGQTSGTYTLAWNTGNGGNGELYAAVNGGALNGPTPVAATGSVPEAISLGQTIDVKLYTPGKKQLLASVTVTAKSALQLAAPCIQQCITSVQVDPHGTFANFHIVTSASVKVTLEAHVQGQSAVASATFDLGMDKDWHTYLMDLKPNTIYTYDVKATDAEGNVQHKTGIFATLRRQVTVQFTGIHVISEDDEDMHFFFNVNNFWDTGNCYPNGPTFDSCPMGELDPGTTVDPGYIKVAIDVPDTLTLMVQGVEDNCSGFIPLPIPGVSLCTNGLGLNTGQLNGGANGTVWATAVGQIPIGSGNKLVDDYDDTFTIHSPAADYQFYAMGTIKVTYVK